MADLHESDDDWIRLPAVEQEVGLKGSTILEWARKGKFPKQIRISHKVAVWRRGTIREWKANRAKGA